MADDDAHYFDDPAFANPDEPNPCGDVYFGQGSAVFDCMKPKGHHGDHANTYGVGWGVPEPHVSGREDER